MENYSIYKFTFPDGKIYIGLTKQNVEKRWDNGEGYKGQDVYIPITLFGWNNIKKEILHTNLTKEQAFKIEQHYITKYKTVSNGYNKNGEKENNETEEGELIDNRADLIINNTSPRILTFKELLIIAEKYPNLQVIVEEQNFGICYSTALEASNSIDIFKGGFGHYTGQYNSYWRVWIGNPTASQLIKAESEWISLDEGWKNSIPYIKNKKERELLIAEYSETNNI